VLREQLELLFDFAERGGLCGFALLQLLAVGIKLELERLNKRLDGFLSLSEIAFGGFLKFAEALFGEAQEFRRGLFQRIRAQSFEGIAQVGKGFGLQLLRFNQRFLVHVALFGEQFFGRGLLGFSSGAGVRGVGQLDAQFGKFGLALRDLLPQFFLEAIIRRRDGAAARAEKPADDEAENAAKGKTYEEIGHDGLKNARRLIL
jgi:hypothetical protein